MNRRIPAMLTLATLSLMAVGCAGKKPAPASKPVAIPTQSARAESARAANSRHGGSVAEPVLHTRLDVYHLTLPYGTVSRNEAFWKRVDEQCIDVATHDLLYKNGVRVGQAPIAEWPLFRDMLDEHPARVHSTALVNASKPIELQVRKQMESQVIFYFDRRNELKGRSYDQCVNFLTMTFHPVPRRPESVRVVLCPVVRSLRTRLEMTDNDGERQLAYSNPERIYDVNLRSDVSPDSFLIVAPSAEATWATSIGQSFLIQDGEAEQTETVLLIIPRRVPVERNPLAAGMSSQVGTEAR